MKRYILIFAAGGALLLSFQNCTKATYTSKENAVNMNGGTGTGNGYDGKIYAVISVNPCPDSTYIQAAILVKDATNDAYLIREACQSVPAQLLAPQSYTIRPNEQIEYNGSVYQEIPKDELPPLSPVNTDLLCDRLADIPYDNFTGTAQIQIFNAAPENSGAWAVISTYDGAGTWKRASAPFPVTVSTVNGAEVVYTYENRDTGDYFNLSFDKYVAYGSYKITEIRDVTGSSARPPIEIWNGLKPYNCRLLPW